MGDHRAQDVKGKIKEAAGDLTGNEDLEAKGKTDQAKADVKEKVGDLKNKAADALNSLTGKDK